MEISREEMLLESWVRLSSILKNNRITKDLAYNESIVMLILYRRFQSDPTSHVSIQDIIHITNMKKSLVNRTINSLEKMNLLVRIQNIKDKRTQYVQCVKENLDTFLKVHQESLKVVKDVIDIIGEEDTDRFISIVSKIINSGYKV